MAVKHKYYRPLPDCLTIKESSIEGLGLFTKKDIEFFPYPDLYAHSINKVRGGEHIITFI